MRAGQLLNLTVAWSHNLTHFAWQAGILGDCRLVGGDSESDIRSSDRVVGIALLVGELSQRCEELYARACLVRGRGASLGGAVRRLVRRTWESVVGCI